MTITSPKACPDCGVAPGEHHEPLTMGYFNGQYLELSACDQERCPACGVQLMSCPCEKRLADDVGQIVLDGRQYNRLRYWAA